MSLQMIAAKASSGDKLVIGSLYFQLHIPPPEASLCTSSLIPGTRWVPQQRPLCRWPRLRIQEALRDRLLRSLLPGHQARLHGIIQLKIDKGFISRSMEKKQIDGEMIKMRG